VKISKQKTWKVGPGWGDLREKWGDGGGTSSITGNVTTPHGLVEVHAYSYRTHNEKIVKKTTFRFVQNRKVHFVSYDGLASTRHCVTLAKRFALGVVLKEEAGG
jgi:hypothetical protein